MELIYEKEINLKSYCASDKGKNIFALATEEGVDIFDKQTKKLIRSIINFSDILDVFITCEDEFIIILDKYSNLYCYDLNTGLKINEYKKISILNKKILSITTSIDNNKLIILYSNDDKKYNTEICIFHLPTLKIIQVILKEYEYKLIRKSEVFNSYYLFGADDTIHHYDEEINYIGEIKKSENMFNIKNCISLSNPNRLIIQDLKKIYIYNYMYKLIDEMSLTKKEIDNSLYKKLEDNLSNIDDFDISIFNDGEIIFSIGIISDKYILSITDNLLLTKANLSIHKIENSEKLYQEKISTEIRNILIIDDQILISGKQGTYLFRVDESDSSLKKENNIPLGILHRSYLISKNKSSQKQ